MRAFVLLFFVAVSVAAQVIIPDENGTITVLDAMHIPELNDELAVQHVLTGFGSLGPILVVPSQKRIFIGEEDRVLVFRTESYTHSFDLFPVRNPKGIAFKRLRQGLRPCGVFLPLVWVVSDIDGVNGSLQGWRNHELVCEVSLNAVPSDVAAHSDGRVYVAATESNTAMGSVFVYDSLTGDLNEVPDGIEIGRTRGIALSIDERTLYVTAGTGVVLLETSSDTFAGNFFTGSSPVDIALHPDGTKVYVTDGGSDSVTVRDEEGLTTIDVGDGPHGVSVTPDGARLFVADNLESSVWMIDTATNEVLDVIEVPSISSPLAFGDFIAPSGGPRFSVDVPVLSGWSLLILVILLAASAVLLIGRRRRT